MAPFRRIYYRHFQELFSSLASASHSSFAPDSQPVFEILTSLSDREGTADGKAEAVVLETVKVQGEWLVAASEPDVKTYPGTRIVLGEKELKRSGARDLEKVLRQAPGLQIRDETGLGILPNIGVRGLNPLRSERVMVLVDGIPLALAPYTGTGLSLFPVTGETVERIDLVRGGVAVRYGQNNVGGVINLITQPIPRQRRTTVKQQLAIAESTGHTFSDTYVRVGGFLTPELGLQLQVNLQAGDGERDHSATDVQNLQLDGQWLPGNDAELKARFQYYKTNAELPGALTPAASTPTPRNRSAPSTASTGRPGAVRSITSSFLERMPSSTG
ncbi:MAG: TonB-dependent receptor plug domain-containing protein [Pseudomonadota bacterium]